jgi:hypothetical protein
MSISRPFIAAAVLLAVIALPACGRSHTSINISDGDIMLHDGYVTVHTDNAPTATVTADGDLRIGSRDIQVDPGQRRMLRNYYSDAVHIGHQGIAIGKAGAHMAGGTVGDVFKNLFSGHPDRIDADVNKRTDKLLAKVQGICDGLQSLQSTQDALAGQLAAFRPYARLHASDIDKCHTDITKARSKIARDTH